MTYKKNKSEIYINPMIIKEKKESGDLMIIETDDGFEKKVIVIEKGWII